MVQLPALAIQQPDIAKAALSAAQLGLIRDKRAALQGSEQRRAALAQVAPDVIAGKEGALGKAAAIAPDETAKLQSIIASANEDQRKSIAATNERIARAAIAADTPERWEAAKIRLRNEGVQVPDAPFSSRQSVIEQAASIDALIKARAPQKAQSTLGKLRADLLAGRISQADYDAEIARKNKSLVNIDMKGETKYAEKRGEEHAKAANEIDQAARTAQTKLNSLNRLEKALSNPDVYTGVGGGLVNTLKSAAKSLGYEVEGASDAEVARAVGNQLALELRNPAGGAGMPGAMSDKDREFLVSMVPGLSTTREGNALLIDYMRRMARRDIEVQALARQYEAENNRIDAGFFQELAEFSAQNPIFTDEDIANAQAMAGPQPTPTAGTPYRPRQMLPASGAGGDVPPLQIQTEADYNALPSGSTYVDPTGVTRRKP